MGVRINAAAMIRQVSVPSNGNDDTNFWIVLNPAETLQVLQVVGVTMFYILSGYLLYI
jgi:hypothetical protein